MSTRELLFTFCVGLVLVGMLCFSCYALGHRLGREEGAAWCRTPGAWEKNTIGHAVAECEAKGGFLNVSGGRVSCVRIESVKP